MEEKEIKTFLEGKLKEVETIIEKKDERIEELLKESVKQAIEKADENGKKVSDVLKSELEAEKKATIELQKQYDALDVRLSELKQSGLKKGKSFVLNMIEDLEKSDEFKRFAQVKKGNFNLEIKNGFFGDMLTKADTMTPALNLTNQVTPVQRMQGFFYDPDRSNHLRENMNVIPTATDTIYYITETMDTNATQVTAPGADKGQSEISLTQNSISVRKISTYLQLAEEMLDDIPGMSAYLTARFTKKLKVKEDQQILYGTNASNQLRGITPVAQAYDGDEVTLGTAIQEIDVLRAAIAQARVDEYYPSLIVLHPNDVRDIDLLKDADNQYIHAGIWGMRPSIAGVPILETTAITEGDFLVGDFRMGATLWDRKQANVKFSDQDQDNFIKNVITVRFEERIAQTVERPNAFVYGSFVTALACGSATA